MYDLKCLYNFTMDQYTLCNVFNNKYENWYIRCIDTYVATNFTIDKHLKHADIEFTKYINISASGLPL